jgi:hypothetical protein
MGDYGEVACGYVRKPLEELLYLFLFLYSLHEGE